MEKAIAVKVQHGKSRINDLQSVKAYSKFLRNESEEIRQAISTLEALSGVSAIAVEGKPQVKCKGLGCNGK